MFTLSTANRRLYWKELRQLLPLAFSLTTIAGAMYLFYALNGLTAKSQSVGPIDGLFVGLPGLFAVGMGALMVGQEKEQRTLQWLSTLPITGPALTRTKLLAGLAGLAIMWLISLLLATVFAGNEFWSNGGDYNRLLSSSAPAAIISYVIHTLFLLLAGFALAWRQQSAWASLLWLIPVAFVPSVLRWLITSVLPSQVAYAEYDSDFILVACQLVCCVVATVMIGRYSRIALSPTAPIVSRRTRTERPKALLAPLRPASALVWQFWAQNRAFVWPIITMILSSLFLTFVVASYFNSGSAIFFAGTLLVLATSGAGVLTFQSDHINRRKRFLADRGISPRTVWLTRMAMPVLLAGSAALAAVVNAQPFMAGNSNQWEWRTMIVTAIVPAVAGLASCFITSVWMGQLIRSPIVAAIAGPAASVTAAGFLAVSMTTLGSGLALAIIAAILPLIGTYLLTRRWLDESYDRTYWLTQATIVALCLALPCLPVSYAWLTSRPLDPATLTAFRTTTPSWMPSSPRELVLRWDDATAAVTQYDDGHKQIRSVDVFEMEFPISSDSSIVTKTEFAIRELDQQVASTTRAIKLTHRALQFLQTELTLTRMALVNEAAVLIDDAKRSAIAAELNQLINLSVRIVKQSRMSPNIMDQELTDQLEILLLREMQQMEALKVIESTTWNSAVDLLADRQYRQSSRRFAIAASWHAYDRTKRTASDLGGISLLVDKQPGLMSLPAQIRNSSRAARIAELLWQQVSQDSPERRQQLAQLLDVTPEAYGLGDAGKYIRADDPGQCVIEPIQMYRFAPGVQWNAGWEQQAQDLKPAS